MNRETIEAKLRDIKTFENEGLISTSGNRINLQTLVRHSQEHFDGLTANFGQIRDEILGSILTFTDDAYLELLARDFVEAGPNRRKDYRPQALVVSARKLSYEMSDGGKVKEIYEALASNFKESRRFTYRLVVRDLSKALEEVKRRDDYSRETFTGFALEVLAQALPYAQGQVQDKWAVFKEQFNAIKDRYFPIQNAQGQGDINERYILDLVGKGPVRGGNGQVISPADLFDKAVGGLYGIQFGSRRDSDVGRVTLYVGNPNTLSTIQFEVTKGQQDIADALVALADKALQNLRGPSFNPSLANMTNRARNAFTNYL